MLNINISISSFDFGRDGDYIWSISGSRLKIRQDQRKESMNSNLVLENRPDEQNTTTEEVILVVVVVVVVVVVKPL